MDEQNKQIEQSEAVAAAERGRTIIEDIVVAKIAGLATREVSGVASMGSSTNRVVGALRDSISSNSSLASGISVQISEDKASIDIGIVANYGVSLQELAGVIRENVIGVTEKLTGLAVTAVNVTIHDLLIELEEENSK
ncbi:MAG: Asp23/Gls24 family envelope stress response protein [Corynebacterium sp.]|nr:Asp23/Gls24 family envelope stress response protein [Corynebacterium sp.]